MEIYISAFENFPDLLLCMDREGRILRINRQAETKLGFDRGELVGEPAEILVPERFRAILAENLKAYFAAPCAKNTGEGLALAARRNDGSEFPIEILLSPASDPQTDKVIAVLRDVTGQQAAENRVRELLGHLRMSSEAAGIGYWTYEEDADRFWCEECFARLFGGTPSDFPDIGSVLERVHPEDREDRVKRAQASLERHGKYESEFRVVQPDGSLRWVADLGRHLEGAGKPLRTFAGVALDITERKVAEEKQAVLIRDLQRSLRENRVLRGLLPICSHCKRIRDELHAWQPLESYINARTEARFSHGICPECLLTYYSDFASLKDF